MPARLQVIVDPALFVAQPGDQGEEVAVVLRKAGYLVDDAAVHEQAGWAFGRVVREVGVPREHPRERPGGQLVHGRPAHARAPHAPHDLGAVLPVREKGCQQRRRFLQVGAEHDGTVTVAPLNAGRDRIVRAEAAREPDHGDAVLGPGKLQHQVGGAVVGTVVDHHELEVVPRMLGRELAEPFDQSWHVGDLVECRDDDRDQWPRLGQAVLVASFVHHCPFAASAAGTYTERPMVSAGGASSR